MITLHMRIVLAFIFILLYSTTYGQTYSAHQIDKELQACLESSENFTTSGMTECIHKATEKWDVELNKSYSRLLTLLTDIQKEKLKISQREWIKFRDKEIEFSNQHYYDMQGTMWIPVAADKALELTRKRTFELENYISNLTFDY